MILRVLNRLMLVWAAVHFCVSAYAMGCAAFDGEWGYAVLYATASLVDVAGGWFVWSTSMPVRLS
jgi:hypothetical protein